MALLFDDTGEAISVGSAAALDDLAQGTVICVFRIDTSPSASGHPARLLSKGGNWQLGLTDVGGAPNVQMFINRATQSLLVNANPTQFTPNTTTGVWYFLAVTFDTNGADTVNKVYRGTLTSPPVEPAAYAVQRSGSGTIVTNATTDLWVGNNPAATTQCVEGPIAFIGLWNRVFTINEIYDQGLSPKPTTGALLFSFPGLEGASAQQTDWSGNGNHGTIQGSPTLVDNPGMVAPFEWGQMDGEAYVVAAAAGGNPWYYYRGQVA